MRKSTAFFLLILSQGTIGTIMAGHAAIMVHAAAPLIAEKKTIVHDYGLTDLCLFTEARYTRHPSLTDLHTPFQDGPLSFEHFPSGTLSGPPPSLFARVSHD